MRTVPIHEFKRRPSDYVALAEGGTPLLITRDRRVVAQLVPPDAHLHVGARFGTCELTPMLGSATNGRYLAVLADDRRGGTGAR
jgi:antitoxin (DNA-binding transcriptional repressor) of toxin-antitoxin stability system